jgi:hypothetical protein
MGNKWTIEVWELDEVRGKHSYREFWKGENVICAIWKMVCAKRKGYGCITLSWRGRCE